MDRLLCLYLTAYATGCVLVVLGLTAFPVLLVPGVSVAALGQGALIVLALRHDDRSDERPAGGWR